MINEIADLISNKLSIRSIALVDILNTIDAIEKGHFGIEGEDIKEYIMFMYGDLLNMRRKKGVSKWHI